MFDLQDQKPEPERETILNYLRDLNINLRAIAAMYIRITWTYYDNLLQQYAGDKQKMYVLERTA